MAKVHYNGNAYGFDVHTDTLIIGFVAVLTFAILTCRRVDSAFLSPFWCRRFDHGPWSMHYETVISGSSWLVYDQYGLLVGLLLLLLLLKLRH